MSDRPVRCSPLRRYAALLALAMVAGCGGAALAPPSAPAARGALETAMGMPGETAMGLPGETAMGMPGGQFSCSGLPPQGTANCTFTLNLNVAPSANPAQPPQLIPGLHPADLQGAYSLPVANPGTTVGVVDAYDAPNAEADLAVYRAAFGLPACTTANGCFAKAAQSGTGAYPAPNGGWAEEAALDLDMVSAACPRCRIVLVEANSASLDDLGASVDTAVRLGAKAVSNSYYALEWANETAQDVHFRHPGVAITASSGDRANPSYPAASQYVTAVGGTSLSANGGGWSETAWPYAGHGCSAYVDKTKWQPATTCRTRAAVDVSAVADPQTGVASFDSAAGGWLVAGGTSVGAPLVAAAYALAGNYPGPSYSYAHPSAFRPVQAPGFTLANGLGTPLGVAGF